MILITHHTNNSLIFTPPHKHIMRNILIIITIISLLSISDAQYRAAAKQALKSFQNHQAATIATDAINALIKADSLKKPKLPRTGQEALEFAAYKSGTTGKVAKQVGRVVDAHARKNNPRPMKYSHGSIVQRIIPSGGSKPVEMVKSPMLKFL
jgi:hypothetical protein